MRQYFQYKSFVPAVCLGLMLGVAFFYEIGLVAPGRNELLLLGMLAIGALLAICGLIYFFVAGKSGPRLKAAEDGLRTLIGEREKAWQALQTEIEQRKRLEQQLFEAHKLDVIGRLAGGVAHDFNNALTIINGRCELMLERLAPFDPLRKEIEIIDKAGNRASLLTRQLLSFSHRQPVEHKVFQPNAVIAEMEKLLRRLLGEEIEVITVLAPNLGYVKADPGQFEQVLMTLAVTVREALPRNGKLIIETRNIHADSSSPRAAGGSPVRPVRELAPGNYIMAAVRDAGLSLDPGTLLRLFESHLNKGGNSNTDLWLATSYNIIKQNGGEIFVESEPERGTAFKVYLPRVESGARPAPVLARQSRTVSTSNIILLVEDDAEVRSFTGDALRLEGFTVLEAAEGRKALEICEQFTGPIHLLLTDVVMPGMSGRELAKRAQPLRPGMRVIYMSGYTEDAALRFNASSSGLMLVQKPFMVRALVSRVREALDGVKAASA